MSNHTVAIVGASLGGVAVAENLRMNGFDGRVVLIGDEPHLPYDRPPLSKTVLTEADPDLDKLLLKSRDWYAEHDIELRLGTPVTALDAATRTLHMGSEQIRADDVVIATGSKPRRLPTIVEDPDVFHLRAWEDGERMSRRLSSSSGHLLILGAGFIGLEVAASARARGWEVSIVERAQPLSRVLPSELSQLCTREYEGEGFNLHIGAEMTAVERHEGHLTATFVSGKTISADLVVVAIGGVPAVDWLDGSGLHIENGIVCDDHGRSSAEGVWAVGDAARWHNHFTGLQTRVEQWQAALEHGSIVAATIAGKEVSGWQEAPYFWSDLVGGRIQFLGQCLPEMDVHSSQVDGKTVAVIGDVDGGLHGIFARNLPKAIARGRIQLALNPSFAEAIDWAEAITPQAAPVG